MIGKGRKAADLGADTAHTRADKLPILAGQT